MDTLKGHSYMLLGTKRKSGVMVETPVWFAPDCQDKNVVYAFSNADAGKVKRLRNFTEATVAPCTVSGKPRGEAVKATAVLLEDPADIAYAHQRLIKTYGWQMRLLDMGARLGRRYHNRSFIKVSLS